MRILMSLALILAPAVASASCTGSGGANICDMARMADETLVPTLPRELAPGIMLTDSAIEGARLDLILTPAADRAVSMDEIVPMICSIDEVQRLVAAGGTLRFMVGSREVGTVTDCPEF